MKKRVENLNKSRCYKCARLRNILIAQGIKLSDIAVILDSTKEQRSFSNLATPQGSHSGILLEVQKSRGQMRLKLLIL